MTATDASALEREVVELHGVIEDWFAGTRPRTGSPTQGSPTSSRPTSPPSRRAARRPHVTWSSPVSRQPTAPIQASPSRSAGSSSSSPRQSWESLATRSGSSTRLERARA
jgi:hypothetical protein